MYREVLLASRVRGTLGEVPAHIPRTHVRGYFLGTISGASEPFRISGDVVAKNADAVLPDGLTSCAALRLVGYASGDLGLRMVSDKSANHS